MNSRYGQLLGEQYDEDDLEFLDADSRAEALGLSVKDPVRVIPSTGHNALPGDPFEIPEITPLGNKERSPEVAQRPLPGWIQIRLGDVARSRGVVNPKGSYRGLPSITAIARGTDITPSTVQAILNDSSRIAMIHFGTLARLCHFLKCQPGDLLVYREGMIRPAESLHGKEDGS